MICLNTQCEKEGFGSAYGPVDRPEQTVCPHCGFKTFVDARGSKALVKMVKAKLELEQNGAV